MPATLATSAAVGQPRRSLATAAAVGVAAAAMVATLPGRTHGLGLITEPLLTELQLGRVPFAALNFWATLLGAAFCVPVGWSLDRFGIRAVLAATLLGLGAVVLVMARVSVGSPSITIPTPELVFAGGLEWPAVPADLFVWVLLTRGLGQSALSVVSLALVGKVAGRKPGSVIGVYSFLVAIGFMAAFAAVKAALEAGNADWRTLWGGIGWILVGAGALAALLVREPSGLTDAVDTTSDDAERSLTLGAALRTPAFWVFGLATSFYGMVAAGMSLFNQSLLAERGFDRGIFLTITTATPLIGLAANLGAGYLATRLRLGTLLAGALFIQAAALAAFPTVTALWEVYAYAAAMGTAGGVLTVVFFTVWRQAFGPVHLGQIQGAAQLLTVLASAAGPLVLAAAHREYGSYSPAVRNLAGVAVAFAVVAWIVPLPNTTPNGTERDQ
jgi:MFS family permease